MNKVCLFVNLLVGLLFAGAALGDQADNGVECSVVMEKKLLRSKSLFSGFQAGIHEQGRKPVRLFDDFYHSKGRGPNISIKIWNTRKRKKEDRPVASYLPAYQVERVTDLMTYITLKPGEKHEVPIKDAYLLLRYLQPLSSRNVYELEVRFVDAYGERGTRREYTGKIFFSCD